MTKRMMLPLEIGVVATALTFALEDRQRAIVAWIAAYMLAAATIVATIILVMVLQLTGARWWLVLRRLFLTIAGTAPLLILLFVPMGAGASLVYTLDHPTFFLVRSAIYLASFALFGVLLRRGAGKVASGIGLPALAFTFTFASFDWLMALDPTFASTIFGVYVFTSGLVSALSVVVIGAWATGRRDLGPDHVHALGRLLLMAVILWTYAGFFQLMLVWIADLPHEAGFYAARAHGTWATAGVILALGRFALPFFVLLSRPLKRSTPMLAVVAAWLLLTSIVEFGWLAFPALGAKILLADVLPFIGLAGLLTAYGIHLFGAGTKAAIELGLPEDALRYRSP